MPRVDLRNARHDESRLIFHYAAGLPAAHFHMTAEPDNNALPWPLWTCLSNTIIALYDAEYAALCRSSSDKALDEECRTLILCFCFGGHADTIAHATARRRYAQSIGVLVARRVEEYQNTHYSGEICPPQE